MIKSRPPQFIKLNSPVGIQNYLELVEELCDVVVYEARSNSPIRMSYNSPDEIVFIDFTGGISPISIGWKHGEYELFKITGFTPIKLYFKKKRKR